MTPYEHALSAARAAPLTLPDFDALAEAAGRARAERLREASDERGRARRWLLASAAIWLLLPLDALPLLLLGNDQVQVGPIVFDLAAMVAPPALISIWGARLARRSGSLRAAILVRAIAASNLVVALLYAISVGGMVGALFTSLLAFASARTLQLLGAHDLDGADDPSTRFTPVRFRGILIAALVMAFADALTLLFSSSVAAVRTVAVALAGLPVDLLSLTLTSLAAAIMAANVWGLLRLRTWALLSNMLCNVAIAGLALANLLAANIVVALGLAVTAGAQLLLIVPILATALGDRQAGRTHARLTGLLRWLVPALVVATVVSAALNFGPALADGWATPHWPN
jgi:hypothetical protein